MKPSYLVLLALTGMLPGCGDPAAVGTNASQPPRDDTPFRYSLTFSPNDPTYGQGGIVQGLGAVWSWGASAAFVLELPVTQVQGTPFGGTELLVALTRYAAGPGNLPEPGQYDIGEDTPDFDGRAWLRDPTRIWYTDRPGFLVIDGWLPDGRVEGRVALQFLRDERDDAQGLLYFGATAAGSFTAATPNR